MVYTQEEFAKIKNRADQSHLISKLQRMEREKKDEIRMLNTEMQRFQNKCSRLSVRSALSLPTKKISNVKLGGASNVEIICPSRSRNSKRDFNIESADFQNIHDLVFTDGTVDVEKIICLHLLSAHRAETLTPACRALRYLCKEHSPAEQLIKRSKRGFTDHEKISMILPLHTIELVRSEDEEEQVTIPVRINDGRLAARILINHQLRLLISTVIDALEPSNPNKLQELLKIGNDSVLLKELLTKTKNVDFIESIQSNPLISNCESFILTPPFVIKSTDLPIKTNTGRVELIIKTIRENVLQMPKRVSMNKGEGAEQNFEAPLQQQNLHAEKDFKPSIQIQKRSIDKTDSIGKISRNLKKSTIADEKISGMHERKNFIKINITAAAKTKKIEYDTDDHISEHSSSTSSKRSSTMSENPRKSWETAAKKMNYGGISKEIIEESEEDNIELNLPSNSPNSKSNSNTLSKIISNKSSQESGKHTNYIKLTTCPACMEKWKTPLPSPKTPRIRRSSGSSSESGNILKTNSIHRINALIDRELYKLESYDRKYSSDNYGLRRSSTAKQELDIGSTEYIKMTPFDLAKIQQEIKERETKKKLEKFLREAF